MRVSLWEVPKIAGAHIVDKILALRIEGGDSTCTVEYLHDCQRARQHQTKLDTRMTIHWWYATAGTISMIDS